MKISKIKNKIGLDSKWKGIKINNKYIFEYLQTSIAIIDKNKYYLLKISSPDGYYSERYTNLRNIKKYLHCKIELI